MNPLILAYIDLFSNILPVFGGGWKIRKMEKTVLWFFLQVVLSAGMEVTSYFMAIRGINNLWMIQWYHLVNVCIIVIILSRWQRYISIAAFFRWSLFIFVLFWTIAKFTFEPLAGDDQYTYTTASVLVLIFAILTLFRFIQGEEPNFFSDPRFWITCGIFFYFTGNFILFSVFKWFTFLPFIEAVPIWNIHWGLNIAVNLIYFRAFLLVR